MGLWEKCEGGLGFVGLGICMTGGLMEVVVVRVGCEPCGKGREGKGRKVYGWAGMVEL